MSGSVRRERPAVGAGIGGATRGLQSSPGRERGLLGFAEGEPKVDADAVTESRFDADIASCEACPFLHAIDSEVVG